MNAVISDPIAGLNSAFSVTLCAPFLISLVSVCRNTGSAFSRPTAVGDQCGKPRYLRPRHSMTSMPAGSTGLRTSFVLTSANGATPDTSGTR